MNQGIRCAWLVLMLVQSATLYGQTIASNVKRILFLGNSITWAGTYVQDVEAYLRAQQPGRPLELMNLGLPSETVSGLSEPGHAGGSFPRPDLHERLERVLAKTKPDLVIACYGMNDGIYLPFDAQRFGKFQAGIAWLHEEVVKAGASIIHLTPPDYDEQRGQSQGYAAVLDRYADWLLAKRASSQWKVVDIHYPMKKYLLAHRKVDAKFRLDGFALAQDGVHPGETGHWIMARQLLVYLGYPQVGQAGSILESLKPLAAASQLVELVGKRQTLMRDAWLTETGHSRPGLPVGRPFSEAQAQSEALMQQIQALLQPPKKD